jgi:radical SAM protein (TIGR01212 family)
LREILTFGKYLNRQFGVKVHKVPVSISHFTCPNIDGTTARGGCTFCENDSFSPNLNRAVKIKGNTLNNYTEGNPYLEKQLEELEEQYYQHRKEIQRVHKSEKFLVYFQSFTNTYAPFETLKALYEKALSFDDVVGISIGTRADSITDEVLNYLQELSKEWEIWVEYGIQSIYDSTLKRINRGESFQNTEKWIEKTKERGLNVCGHLIFGLPDENREMMLNSFYKTIEMGVDSIKIHPLYVVERTALANEYRNGKFEPIDEDEYVATVVDALKELPQNISIQRLTAGIENSTLISPSWCYNKQQNFSKIRKALQKEGLKY